MVDVMMYYDAAVGVSMVVALISVIWSLRDRKKNDD